MGLSTGIGIGIGFSRGSQNWESYWATRMPTGLILTVLSDTLIKVDWTDAAEAADGLKVYFNDVLKATVAFGVETSTITGLTAGTTYTVKIVAYSGVNESDPITGTVIISTLLTGLIDFWELDEASGNATGVNGNVLTNNGTATYLPAVIGNGVSLGTSNSTKSLTKDSAFGMTYESARSIAGWFKILTAPTGTQNHTLLSLIFATNPGNYTVINYVSATGLKLLIRTTLLPKILIVGELYHLACTWDHAGNVSKLYLDGVLVITDAVNTSNYSAQTSRFAVGGLIGVNFASIVADGIGLWNKILSLDEVIELTGRKHPFANNGDVVMTFASYCWFNSVKALYNATANKTWVGIVHNDGTGYSQHILTIDNATGVVSKTKIGTVVEYDDHNEASVLVRSSDNKLFTAYSEHSAPNGILIRTRISTNALDASSWGAESTIDPNAGSTYTYCNAFEVTNGDIYIFFRETVDGGAWWNFVKSTDAGVTFSNGTRVIHKDYLRCWQNPADKDIIHFAVSRHPNNLIANLIVSHCYFDASDESWHKSDGTDVTANIPLEDANMTPIFSVNDPEQGWIEDLFLDSNGYPRVLMSFYPDIDTTPNLKKLYYSEWNGTAWSTPYEIHESMNKNIGLVTLVNTYPPLASFDRGNPDRIFAGKEVSGVCEIFEITRVAADNFTSVQKTTGSGCDQWRPFTVASPNKNVFWLNKARYYSYLNDYNQQLICKTL